MVAHGFSAQSLLLFEPFVDNMLEKFIVKMDSFAQKQKKPFDLYFWFELFTMDLMGELALGNNFLVSLALESRPDIPLSWSNHNDLEI